MRVNWRRCHGYAGWPADMVGFADNGLSFSIVSYVPNRYFGYVHEENGRVSCVGFGGSVGDVQAQLEAASTEFLPENLYLS